jgi:hypothetical protein
MQSDDPDFESKTADVIGLYVNPPDHAALFAVDENTAIQALDRVDPVLPLSPGRAEPPLLRILPARDAVAAGRPRYEIRCLGRRHRAAPHQRRLS